MFNKKLIIGALASVAACSSFAEGSGLSYTYIGLAYQTVEIDDEDGDGYAIAGSVAINDSVFLLGQYSLTASDDEFTDGTVIDDIELTQFSFGIGVHEPISTKTDFVASLSYVDAEVDFANQSADGNGYQVSAGVRAKPSDILEFGASINYADIEDEGEVGYSLSARIFAAPKISFGLGYGSADDVDAVSLDVRFDL